MPRATNKKRGHKGESNEMEKTHFSPLEKHYLRRPKCVASLARWRVQDTRQQLFFI
jgi:hypothetical protein